VLDGRNRRCGRGESAPCGAGGAWGWGFVTPSGAPFGPPRGEASGRRLAGGSGRPRGEAARGAFGEAHGRGGFGEARRRGSPAGRRGEASGRRLPRDRDGVVAARGRIGEKGPQDKV